MRDYKEKYEQAISRAKEVLSRAKETISAMTDMGGVAKVDDILHIFPELSESKDERVKGCIGICLTDATEQRFEDFNTTLKDCLVWLEKQGEQKLADKVEPKFKVGDWIVSNTNPNCVNSIMFIADYNNDSRSYLCRYRDGQMEYSYEFIENSYHLWTIHDAKDGDVLAYPDGTIVLFKYRLDGLNSGIYMSHILLATKIETCQSCAILKDLHPATKEQSDLLFQKMKEAGYEWDIESKKLKKIEQKPAEWHNEDEANMDAVWKACGQVYGIQYQCILGDWLKSLKDKAQPQSMREWSEEDESHIGRILSYLESFKAYNAPHIEPIKKEIDWLKSIKPNHWKPSEEQKSVAERFARIVRGNLIGIDKDVQQKFKQLYFEVTGNKMYGGYND